MAPPTDEKRSVVVLDLEDCEAWLGARTAAEARSLLQRFDPEIMMAIADPGPTKALIR